MSRDDLLAALTVQARTDARLKALLLGGSLGRGEGDAWSDLDLVAVVAPEALADFIGGAQAWVERAAGALLVWRPPHPGLPLFNAVTEDWLRCDLTVTVPGRVMGAQDGLKPLIDRSGVYDALPQTLPARSPDPVRLAALVQEFLRILGLLAVVIGRGEYVVGVSGAGMLRSQLITLLIEELGLAQPPGALHLSRLLTPGDMRLLDSMPSVEATRPSVIAAHRAMAGVFLPRARRVLAQAGAPWPGALEAATLAHLRRALGEEWGRLEG